MRLFSGETVTMKTEWFELDGRRAPLLPYSDFDVAVVSVMSRRDRRSPAAMAPA